MEELKIKIKYHDDELPKVEAAHTGEWYDLRAAENRMIYQGESAMISLGVSIELPEGYEAIVAPRSSTFKNWGIIMVNGIGVIDHRYCGTNDIWRFPAFCLTVPQTDKGREKQYAMIEKGDRICQFRIQKVQPSARFEKVMQLNNEDRGGLGSTGTR